MATVALTILSGPLGLLKRGHDLGIKSGQVITACAEEDAEIELPVEPPPHDWTRFARALPRWGNINSECQEH